MRQNYPKKELFLYKFKTYVSADPSCQSWFSEDKKLDLQFFLAAEFTSILHVCIVMPGGSQTNNGQFIKYL